MFARTRGERGAFGPISMPRDLKRTHGQGDLHFITFSCYRRLPLLGSAEARNAVVRALQEVHRKYDFALVGFVVMPEHAHLLIGEPKTDNPSTVLHSLKLRVSQHLRQTKRNPQALLFGGSVTALTQFWQKRFYDFNVWSAAKRRDKLEYMHRNPVTRKPVTDPKDWAWSSYASYSGRGTPIVEVDYVP